MVVAEITAATNNQRRPKKRKTKGSEDKSKKCKTVTLKLVCLSDKDQSETHDAEEQRDLLLADLGEVKITVPEESDELEIRDLIMEMFPKPLDAGGFELLYTEPRERDLRIIPPGPRANNEIPCFINH